MNSHSRRSYVERIPSKICNNLNAQFLDKRRHIDELILSLTGPNEGYASGVFFNNDIYDICRHCYYASKSCKKRKDENNRVKIANVFFSKIYDNF